MRHFLLVSFHKPSIKHAGGLRLLDIYSELRNMWPDVHLTLFTCDNRDDDIIDKAFTKIFNEIYVVPAEKFSPDFFSGSIFIDRNFDLIDLQYHQAGKLIAACRARWPEALLIFSPMESQVRALKILITSGLKKIVFDFLSTIGLLRNSMLEILYLWHVDRVVTVSDSDKAALTPFVFDDRIFSLPTCVSNLVFPPTEMKPCKVDGAIVVFLAYFGSQTNREALIWFLHSVHPLIRDAVPGYRLRVVGGGLAEEIVKQYTASDVDFIGSVDSVISELKDAAVGVAPALSGAGIRGKIHQYAALGIPCVASPISCESLIYKNGESIFLAESIEEFADACIILLRNYDLRSSMGMNAHRICLSEYIWSRKHDQLRVVYGCDCYPFGESNG